MSGQKFEPGDIVVCLIYVDLNGDLARMDILEAEEAEVAIEPSSIMGRWKREVKQPGTDSEAKQQAIQSAEDLFLSLFAQNSEDKEEVEDLKILKHFLSLMLERKRLLKAVPPRSLSGTQAYIYTKTKETYNVPVVDVTPEALMKVQTIIDDLASI